MITVKPFAALLPKVEYAKECAALPYDVMSSDEAREEVKEKPYSFLHIDKAEIDLPLSVHLYDEQVYQKAADNLAAFEAQGVYVQSDTKKFYFYRQIMNGRAQTGIVGCASIDDYINGNIKKHELTRADKEIDRIKHVDTCSAQTGPIFLVYKESEALDSLIQLETQKEPLFDFTSDDNVRHTVWETSSADVDKQIGQAFAAVDSLYIADGHHRAASAVKAGLKRREKYPDYTGEEEFNYFLSVIFPAKQLKIFDYNRLLADLGGRTSDEFLQAVEENLGSVTPYDGGCAYRPTEKGQLGLFVGGKWYVVRMYRRLFQSEKPSERLDCAVLQNKFLAPVLGIQDPRTDKRIDFAGGIRGLSYLEKRCAEDMAAAIVMYPTSMEELTSVADAGEIMPPKSTWFEPKLRSGLFIHKIER